MLVVIFGLVLGLMLGLVSPYMLPLVYSRYLSIAILSAIDTAFGGLRASLDGTYDNVIFISGFFANATLAAALVFLGDRLGVENLYLAGVAALGIRIFNNIGYIRRALITKWGSLRRKQETSVDKSRQA